MAAIEGESTANESAIRVTRRVTIPRREIELRFSRSSGPGGQHAQRTETRVEALFDVNASSALGPRQKERVIAKAGPVLRAVAQDERSQWRNRELAVERLVAALREALAAPRPRRPTRPTAESVERRLDEKRRRARTKRLRQPPDSES
jgi:ribosome-associated protein